MSDTPKTPETKPAMPAQPPTRQLPALSDRAMLEDLYRIAKQSNTEIQSMGIDIRELKDDTNGLTARMTLVERKIDAVESSSIRPRLEKESNVNLQQEAVLATILTDIATVKTDLKTNTDATLAMKSALLDDVRGFFKNHPQVGQAVIAALMFSLGMLINFLKAHQ